MSSETETAGPEIEGLAEVLARASAAFHAVGQAEPDEVPKTMLTAEQWAVQENVSGATARLRIRKLVDSGQFKCENYRLKRGARKTPHYGPVV
jgi:hypothetical protein